MNLKTAALIDDTKLSGDLRERQRLLHEPACGYSEAQKTRSEPAFETLRQLGQEINYGKQIWKAQ